MATVEFDIRARVGGRGPWLRLGQSDLEIGSMPEVPRALASAMRLMAAELEVKLHEQLLADTSARETQAQQDLSPARAQARRGVEEISGG